MRIREFAEKLYRLWSGQKDSPEGQTARRALDRIFRQTGWSDDQFETVEIPLMEGSFGQGPAWMMALYEIVIRRKGLRGDESEGRLVVRGSRRDAECIRFLFHYLSINIEKHAFFYIVDVSRKQSMQFAQVFSNGYQTFYRIVNQPVLPDQSLMEPYQQGAVIGLLNRFAKEAGEDQQDFHNTPPSTPEKSSEPALQEPEEVPPKDETRSLPMAELVQDMEANSQNPRWLGAFQAGYAYGQTVYLMEGIFPVDEVLRLTDSRRS